VCVCAGGCVCVCVVCCVCLVCVCGVCVVCVCVYICISLSRSLALSLSRSLILCFLLRVKRSRNSVVGLARSSIIEDNTALRLRREVQIICLYTHTYIYI